MGDSEVDELRQEVVRLTVELDRTSAEKEQAAQYGLVLLEEKDSLDLRCQVKIITSDADPYHVESIRIQKLKKFVTDPCPSHFFVWIRI